MTSSLSFFVCYNSFMNDFVIKDVNCDILQELESIGFDIAYRHVACDKYRFKNIKIFDLTIAQANILKQTAISVGADCAVHRETITAKVEKTDCLLGGSYSQLKKISQKLRMQPFGLAKLAELIENDLALKLPSFSIKGNKFDFTRPYLVGVLNLTQNSFSDGGEFFETEAAQKRLVQLVEDGADIIDIGAESTKPFSLEVPAKNQLEKLLPILQFVKNNQINVPISIDTRSALVAQACIDAGADIINDVSGLTFDSSMVDIVAKCAVPIVIQHSKGNPDSMQVNPNYDNLIDEIFLDLRLKAENAIAQGVKPENIIVDIGIGFGKTKEQNFKLMERIQEFASLGYPIMVGVSRKSLLAMPDADNFEKDIYTLALNAELMNKSVNFIRVHNVKMHKKLLQVKFVES